MLHHNIHSILKLFLKKTDIIKIKRPANLEITILLKTALSMASATAIMTAAGVTHKLYFKISLRIQKNILQER